VLANRRQDRRYRAYKARRKRARAAALLGGIICTTVNLLAGIEGGVTLINAFRRRCCLETSFVSGQSNVAYLSVMFAEGARWIIRLPGYAS